MAPFSLNHAKTSQKLRQMVAHGANRREILRAVPMNYYPRLDEAYGRDFVRRYLEDYSDVSLINTFVARGMDLNVVNEDGATLLHALARSSGYSADAVEELFEKYIDEGLRLDIRDDNGHTALDVLKRYNDYRWASFVVDMTFAEGAQLYRPGTTGYIEHLHGRYIDFAERFSVRDMKRLLDAGVTYDMQPAGKPSVFMTALRQARMDVVKHVLQDAPAHVFGDSADAVRIVVGRTDDVSLIEMIANKQRREIDSDTVCMAAGKRNVYFLQAMFDLAMRYNTNSVMDNNLRRKIFESVLKTGDVEFIGKVLKSDLLANKDLGLDIDDPVFEGGRSLLLHTISRGYINSIKEVLDLNPDLRKVDGNGQGILELAQATRNRDIIALIEAELKKLNQRGDFERVHDSQISYKTGVLTYIFDFHAGQVVVRDNETKNISSTPIADFAKSGAKLVGEAARTLTDLGGDAQGYEAAKDALSVPRRPQLIDKKPSA